MRVESGVKGIERKCDAVKLKEARKEVAGEKEFSGTISND